MPRPLRFRERLDRYPPILIRLLTTWGDGASRYVPTDRQLAQSSGLRIADVKWVSYSTSWEFIPHGVSARFMAGCKIDLENRRTFRRLEWMRRNGQFEHLKIEPLWSGQFEEMLQIWMDGL